MQTPVELRQRHSNGFVEFIAFDQEYVRLLAEGDPSTEQHFVSYFGELIRIKLRSRLRSLHLVDEVRQETFLRVLNMLRRKGGLEHPERLGAFVNTTCNNVMFESLRAETRTDPYPGEEFDPVDSRADVESEFVNEERKRMVKTVLSGMPAREQDLLRSVFLEEKDKDEICRQLDVDREYLRVLIHRAKGCFRSIYSKKAAAPSGKKPRSG